MWLDLFYFWKGLMKLFFIAFCIVTSIWFSLLFRLIIFCCEVGLLFSQTVMMTAGCTGSPKPATTDFGHLGPTETTCEYSTDVSSAFKLIQQRVSKELLIYTSIRYRVTSSFVWSRVSGHLMNAIIWWFEFDSGGKVVAELSHEQPRWHGAGFVFSVQFACRYFWWM